MNYRIEVANCCGAFCAKFFDAEDRKLYHETADQRLYDAWAHTPMDSLQELRAEWVAKLNALTKLLNRLSADGVLTEEQISDERVKWQNENPTPAEVSHA